MKKNLFILAIISSQLLFGQTEIENVWLSEYNGDSLTVERFLVQKRFQSDNCFYRISFDTNGDTSEVVTKENDRFGNDSIETWSYGLSNKKFTLHWYYDKMNYLIYEYRTYDDDESIDTTFFVYNSSGHLIKKVSHSYNSYPYDSLIYRNGKLVEIISYSSGEIIARVVHKYSKNGNLKIETTFNEDGEKIRQSKYSYNFRNKKLGIKRVVYPPYPEKKQIVETRKYFYDNSGQINEIKAIHYDRGFRETMLYDSDGKLTKLIRKELLTDIITMEEYEIVVHELGL